MKRLMMILVAAAVVSAVRAHPGHETLKPTGAPSAATEVTIVEEGGYRVIRANGIPDHATGAFPSRGNPNTIAPQRYEWRVPACPKLAERPTATGMNLFGVALNGVPFDPSAAEWWRNDRASGWQYDALGGGRNLGIDREHAHVQPSGAYHYHGVPLAMVERLSGGEKQMTLVGWAADGFPIYAPWIPSEAGRLESGVKRARSSYRTKSGERPGGVDGPGGKYDGVFVQDWEFVAGAGDLDACNGRVGATPEFPGGTYYYVLTEEFPFVPRMWRGTPDASFVRRGPPGGGGPGKKKGKAFRT